MTRVGWLADVSNVTGGAELTQAEFKKAAPDGIEIVDCSPGGIVLDLDRYVIHNCVLYPVELLQEINAPTVKYWHDVGPHVQPGVKEWLSDHATQICCSPIQAEHMGLDVQCIPPPVDLSRFEHAAAHMNGNRAGQVSVGSWRNYGKAAHKVVEWSQRNGPVDFFGDGPFAPTGSTGVPYDAMPRLLAQYERFVFLPMVLEPFGRLVAEAWAAGCEIVTNGLVGARYWIEEGPEAIDTAAEDFWKVVMS
jgi:hypothetical protein